MWEKLPREVHTFCATLVSIDKKYPSRGFPQTSCEYPQILLLLSVRNCSDSIP
ncbi:hypothetical protein EVA_01250 [gut metagenome]|uniref:Uncharacterized protein n=1 Tax=gut metagenome TaxID=749906 RepID=J9GRC1_9ZZZZ